MNTDTSPSPSPRPEAGTAVPDDAAGMHPIDGFHLSRRHIWVAVLVALFIGYLLAGFLGVPYLARTQLQSFVKKQYGRTLQVREIHFNPLTFRVEAAGVALPDADGQPMIGFERLTVQPSLAMLWRFAPSFREISLEGPQVRVVVRHDGSVNIADLAKGSEPAKPAPEPTGAPMRLFVDQLRVVGGSGVLEDQTLPGPFIERLQPVDFELTDFSTRTGAGNVHELTAASQHGARLKWDGTFSLQPLSAHGSIELTGVPLSTLWVYARNPLPIAAPPGSLGLHARYDAALSGGALALKLTLPDITVSGLKVRPASAASDYVDLPSIVVSNTNVDLQQRTVEIGQVVESGGSIDAWLAHGGQLNLLEMLPAAPSSPAAPRAEVAKAPTDALAQTASAPAAMGTTGTTGTAGPWRVSAPDIEVRHVKIAAEDREVTPAAKLSVDPLDVKVTGFSTAPGTQLDVSVNTAVNGGKLAVKAKLIPDTSAATATVDLAGLDLRGLQPYLSAQTGMILVSGTLGTHLGVERAAGGALDVKGDVDVNNLRSVDDQSRQDFIRWKELRLAGLRYASKPQSLKVGTVTVRAPYARVIVFPDLTTNVGNILTPRAQLHGRARRVTDKDRQGNLLVARTDAVSGGQAQPSEAAQPPAAPRTPSGRSRAGRKGMQVAAAAPAAPAAPVLPFAASIKSIEVIDASVNYADYWIQPNFAVGIQSLKGSVKGLSSDPKSRAQVKLDGQVDRYAPAHIGGTFNLLSAVTYSDVQLGLKGVDMTSVTPYSGHFAGYKIDKGKLTVDLSYKVENRQLAAQQHVVINQLQLGEKVDSKEAVKLPLKLAVALLKDRNGVIDIGLPMTGSLDDPQFSIGPLIWKTLLNLLDKIVTAPFAALGHLFGGGETMNVIEFSTGSPALDPDAKQKVDSITKALTERPALQLDIPAAYSDGDRQVLAQAHLQQRLQKAAQGKKAGAPPDAGVLADPARRFRLLLSVYRATANGADLPASALAASQSKATDSAALAAAISELEAAILSRIQVTDSELEELGTQRAQAIEDSLVAGGVDAQRVFIVKEHHTGAGVQGSKGSAGKVAVELALK